MSRDLQPVMVEHTRDHAFVKQTKRGCGECGKAKTDTCHHGAPPTLNALGSGNQFAFQAHKKAWQALLIDLVAETDLPHGLAAVLVEGEMTFPDRKRRDQGNHRFLIEKALGDALVEGGWLEDDDWSRFEFGGLAYRYEKGVSRTRLTIFPTPAQEMAA
jgi:hypothetical protein